MNRLLKSQKPLFWSRLDNAAKIFPPTSSKRDSKVFRFSCELTEEVDPQALQTALDQTLEQFPFYRSSLKKGLFWYYLEGTARRPQVQPERLPPCTELYRGQSSDPLFRVVWYRRRISLEAYHALTDGTGALHFLRVLVYHYLLIVHRDAFPKGAPAIDYDASHTQKMDDGFARYYARDRRAPAGKPVKAFHLRGETLSKGVLSVVEGAMVLKPLLAAAKSYHTTLTVFLTAVMMQAIHSQMTLRDERRPVVVSVPVNLRNYFPSDTARNFFGVVNVSYDFRTGSGELDDVIRVISESLKEQLTEEKLAQRMNRLAALEHTMLVRVIPLFIKIPVLRFFHWNSEKEVTAAFSNLGRIDMPPAMRQWIRLFDVFLSTRRMQACASSFEDRFVITFTTPLASCEVERNFFRILSGMGIDVIVTANHPEEVD